MKYLIVVILIAMFILNFQIEKFDIIDDVKSFPGKIDQLFKDIEALPEKVKKEVVDPAFKPFKDLIDMMKNIKIEDG